MRVVEKIWGSSPATGQLDNGIESEILKGATELKCVPSVHQASWRINLACSANAQLAAYEEISIPCNQKGLARQHNKDYKQQRLKCNLPVDAELLYCVQKVLEVKLRLVERMEHMNKVYTDIMFTLSVLGEIHEKLMNSIS